MANELIVIYDTETSGLDAKTADFAQLASIAFLNDQYLGSFNQLANPGHSLPPGVTEIHGITDEMVKDAPSSQEVAHLWAASLEALVADTGADYLIVGGHNEDFDFRFLSKHLDFDSEVRRVCSYRLSQKADPDAESHKLERLFDRVETLHPSAELKGAHDALTDVWMSYMVFRHYMGLAGVQSFADLHAYLSKPMRLKRMPFGKHKGELVTSLPSSYMKYMLSMDWLGRDVRETFEGVLSSRG